MNVLAIDQRTSSTKALVVAEGGEVLGEGNAPVHPRAGADGAVEQDPQELLDSIVEAGRAAIQSAGAEVEAVGLANQGETVLRWNRETGEPYGPALSWQDRRAVSVTRDLGEHEERLTEITGLPVDPYLGRLAKAREIALGALFLASDESSYVTGSTFAVDGGLTAAYVTPE